jgi:hypothetical protein
VKQQRLRITARERKGLLYPTSLVGRTLSPYPQWDVCIRPSYTTCGHYSCTSSHAAKTPISARQLHNRKRKHSNKAPPSTFSFFTSSFLFPVEPTTFERVIMNLSFDGLPRRPLKDPSGDSVSSSFQRVLNRSDRDIVQVTFAC